MCHPIRSALWVLLGVGSLSALGCRDLTEPSAEYEYEAVFTNDAALDIHILAPGEDYSSRNRIAPGRGRNVTIIAGSGVRVLIRAGRLGSDKASTKCFLEEPDRHPLLIVVYTEVGEQGALSCRLTG